MAMTPSRAVGGTLSESGYRPASVGSRRSARSTTSSRRSRGSSIYATSSAADTDVMGVPPRSRHWYDSGSLPQAGRLAMTGLPGYTGYIPGKVAENVHGKTFQQSNETATAEVHNLRHGNISAPGYRAPGPRAGTEIPGYMGFVPGKYCDNVIWQSQAKAAETAHLIKEHQKHERKHRVASYRMGERPPTGTMEYSGYRSFGGPPGTGSRAEN